MEDASEAHGWTATPERYLRASGAGRSSRGGANRSGESGNFSTAEFSFAGIGVLIGLVGVCICLKFVLKTEACRSCCACLRAKRQPVVYNIKEWRDCCVTTPTESENDRESSMETDRSVPPPGVTPKHTSIRLSAMGVCSSEGETTLGGSKGARSSMAGRMVATHSPRDTWSYSPRDQPETRTQSLLFVRSDHPALEPYFEVLEIPDRFSIQDLSRCYKKVARSCHPDKNLDGEQAAKEKFQLVTDANSRIRATLGIEAGVRSRHMSM